MSDRDILYKLIASLTLADHLRDVGRYVREALRQAGTPIEFGSQKELMDALHSMGVTTLYGTAIGGDDG